MSSIWSFLRSNVYKDQEQPINLPSRNSEHSGYVCSAKQKASLCSKNEIQLSLRQRLDHLVTVPCYFFFSTLPHIMSCPTSLHDDDWGAVNGLHDGSQTAAQIMGGVPHFGGLFKHHHFCRTVQDSGQEFAELFLKRIWITDKYEQQ